MDVDMARGLQRANRRRHHRHPEEHYRGTCPGTAAMNLAPSEFQNSITASVSEFLRDSVATGGGSQPGGGDERDLVVPNDVTWKSYAQLGWVGMTVSEAYGGVGLGLAEEVMLFREIGRYLASGPFLGSALGARVAAAGGEKELVGRICSGRCRVGVLVR